MDVALENAPQGLPKVQRARGITRANLSGKRTEFRLDGGPQERARGVPCAGAAARAAAFLRRASCAAVPERSFPALTEPFRARGMALLFAASKKRGKENNVNGSTGC